MGKKLFVGNLPYTADDSALSSLFASVGTVESCKVIVDRETGRSKGFAFVEMSSDDEAAKAEAIRQEKAKLEELKIKFEKKIESQSVLKQFKKQLMIDITPEGLRIQIVDEKSRPMFNIGSALLQPYAKEILSEISKVLNDVPNTISLSGHTDATPYSGGERGYSNWELSADRANACRRELVGGGIEDGKILRVVGLGSAVPFDKSDPANPVNRRISIIVMNKQTEEAVRNDGGKLEVNANPIKEVPKSDAAPIVQP